MSAPAAAVSSREWMEAGTGLFLKALGDAHPGAAATALPGWTRGHVAAHVASNADALLRLVSWARTGVVQAMYGSREQRNEEIELGSALPADELLGWVRSSAGRLSQSLADLPPADWDNEVVTIQGRTVTAAELPWLRAREVNIHAVDLAVGVSFGDLPAGFCLALVEEIAASRSRSADGPALLLSSEDRTHEWTVSGVGQPTACVGDPPALAQWLTGRGDAGVRRTQGLGPVPVLPRWL